MSTTSFLTQLATRADANAINKIVTTSSGAAAILDQNKALYVLGNASSGELGDGTTVNKSTPVALSNLGDITTLESGYANFGVVTNDRLYTWGNNSGYQIGDGTTVNKSSPIQTTIIKPIDYPWKSITQGTTHFAAIRTTDSALFTWGNNAGGQLGDGTTLPKSTPTKIGNKSWSVVSAGISYTAAVDSTGVLYTWGLNNNYQMGDGTTINKSSPVLIASGTSWTFVSTGENHATAIDIDGKLHAWGLNNAGQVGYLTGKASYSTPTKIPSSGTTYPWKQLSANDDGTLTAGITTAGTLYTWGLGTSGQLGDNTAVSKSSPVQVGTSSWSVVSTGNSHIAAIDTNGNLYAWGLGTSGQLGDNTIVSKSTPVLIPAEYSASTFSANTIFFGSTSQYLTIPSNSQTAFQSNNFTIEGWFYFTNGAVNTFSIISTNYTTFSAGSNSIFFGKHTNNGGVVTFWCSNANAGGPLLSDPTLPPSNAWTHYAIVRNGSIFTMYRNGLPVTTATYAGSITAATNPLWIATDGSAPGSVNNFNGYLHNFRIVNGTAVYTSNFTPPTSPLTAIANTALLIGQSDTLVDNSGNNLAITNNGSVPVSTQNILTASLPRFSSWSAVSAGALHTTAVDINGALFAWGSNATGQVGHATLSATYSTPTKIQTAIPNTSWKQLVANEDGTLTAGITTDGALFTWGLGTTGQLGDNTVVSKSSPVRIGTSSWNIVAAGNSHIAAIDTNGNLYAWGLNASGQLGVGDTTNRSSPVQIPAVNFSAGTLTTNAVLFNGTNQYATFPYTSNFNLSAGDFTMEGWFNSRDFSAAQPLISKDTNGSNFDWDIGILSATSVRILTNGANSNLTATVPAMSINTWYHIAIVKYNGIVNIYLNGVSYATGALALTNNSQTTVTIGCYSWNAPNSFFKGYISNLHIVNGTALYTSNFNPPTAPTTANLNTVLLTCNSGTFIDNSIRKNTITPVNAPTVTSNTIPTLVAVNTSWSAVSTGSSHTTAIDINGNLYAWGNSATGQLGDGTTVNKRAPIKIGSSSWTSVSSGISHSVGITTTGALFVWGGNTTGQLGDGTTINKSSPIQIGSSSWSLVSAGASHTTGVLNTGALFAWGGNTTGQLGDGTTINKSSPVLTLVSEPIRQWSKVSYASSAAAAIDSTGALWTWGANDSSLTGQIGDGTTVSKSSPVKIGSSSWSAVSAGLQYVMAITTTGGLFAWGRSQFGNLGDGTTVSKSSPVKIGASSWAAVSSGNSHVIGIDSTGALYTWGDNANGQIGDGTTVSKSSPVKIGSSSWSKISAGSGHSLAIDITGALYAWGQGNIGQLGDNAAVNRSSPVKIGTSSWSAVASGSNHNLAIDITGALYAWGRGTSGQLGDNTILDKISPVKIGTNSWAFIASGDGHSIAIDTTGSLYAWGFNSVGQLGDGTTVTKPSPVKIGSSSWTLINAGGSNAAAINSNGLFTWGLGASGQLGDGTTISKSSPVFVWAANSATQIVSWSSVNSGASHSAAISTTGSLYLWGGNASGQLGDGLTINKSTAIKIGPYNNFPTISWSSVSAGGSHTTAITTANTAYVWGLGTSGQLGDRTVVSKSSPVLVSAFNPNTNIFSSWSTISAGASHTTGINTTGALYAWGGNAAGQLGDGTTINKSTPTSIGSVLPSNFSIVTNGNSLTVPATGTNSGFNFTTAPFTIEGWYFFTSGTGTLFQIGSEGTGRYVFYFNGAYTLGSSIFGTGTNNIVSFSPSTWYHIAVVRVAGGAVTVYVNGVAAGFVDSRNQTVGNGSMQNIGAFNGALSNFRVVNGVAVYTANFTPPTAPLNVIPGTQLLTGQNATLVDNSGNNFAIGNNGATISSIFTPFITTNNPNTSSWSSVSAGASHTTAIDTMGKLYGWGSNVTGQLGRNSLLATTFPIQTGEVYSTWKKVSNDYYHTLAIRNSDSSLWTWGLNTAGQLGDGTTVNRSQAIQIGNSSWAQVAGNGSFSVAIDTTGALYAWGQNVSGQLGDGTTINKSSPVKIGTSSWSLISAGGNQVAAITTTGALFTWGAGTDGYLGSGTTISRSSPVQIGTSSWTSVTTGFSHSVGITTDGSLFTWGKNEAGQLGDGTTISKSSPVKIGTNSWTMAGAIYITTAAIDTTGALYVWGLNSSGQIGDGTTVNKSSPVKIGSSSWTYVSAPDSHILAIRTDGALFTWGSNPGGNLGDNTVVNKSSPVQIGTSSWSIVKAGGGYSHSIGITNAGDLFAWGTNTFGTIGDGTTVSKSSPVQLTSVGEMGTLSWSSVNSGGSHTAGITTTGSLYTWGGNASGQLGDGTTVNKLIPSKIGNSSWSAINAGGSHTAAITTANTAYIWGLGTSGQLGDNTLVSKSSPVLIGIYNEALNVYNISWSIVSTGLSHTVGITTANTLYVWGLNNAGQLGDGTTVNKFLPIQIGSLSWSLVNAGASHTVGVTTANTLHAWGLNSSGQLGDNTAVSKSSPVLISIAGNNANNITKVIAEGTTSTIIKNDGTAYMWGTDGLFVGLGANKSTPVIVPNSKKLTSWKTLSAGYYNSMGISDHDKSLWTFGQNDVGQLGDGTTINRPYIQLLNGDSWSTVSSGYSYATGINTTGALYVWGGNASGQLGDGTTINKSSPVKIGTNSWSVISSGNGINQHTAGITSTGALFTWGNNATGQLGDGTTINKSSPIQIGTRSWTSVSAGPGFSAAIDITGALYVWGTNGNGNLGDGTVVNKSSPVKIGSSSWSKVSLGNNMMNAITISGALFTWGIGTTGQLGDNTAVSKSSPIQIGTSSWSVVACGNDTMAAIDITGRLFTWGAGTSGRLGDGTNTVRSSPVQIGAAGFSYTLVSSYAHSIAQTTFGNLYGWGDVNSAGGNISGIGDNIQGANSPVLTNTYVTNIKNAKGIGWKDFNTLGGIYYGIDSTDSLYAWGTNTNNSLGFNAYGTRATPDIVNIAGSNLNIVDVAMGNNTTIAITTDNETNSYLYAWGNNAVGQYGDGSTVTRSSPVLVTQLATGYTANLFSGGSGSNFRR